MNRFFARLFGKPSSKDVAKERLQLVLLGDRGISAELLTAMKILLRYYQNMLK